MFSELRMPAEMDQDWYDKSLRCYVFAETGAYRTSLGTNLCVVCRHYIFRKDDIARPLSFDNYHSETGHRIKASDLWMPKALIAKAQCAICGALYLVHCYGHDKEVWLEPYNMSFYGSFAEHPLKSDLRYVEPRWLRCEDPAPHLVNKPIETNTEEGRLALLQKKLAELKAKTA